MIRSSNAQNFQDPWSRIHFERASNNFTYSYNPDVPVYPTHRMFGNPNLYQIPYVVANNQFPDNGNTCPVIQQILLPNSFNITFPELNTPSLPINSHIPPEKKQKNGKTKPHIKKEENKREESKVITKEIKECSFWNSSDFIILKDKENKADFSAQLNDKDIFQAYNTNETKLKCKYCDFMAENRRSLGGHVSRHHPNISENYRRILLRRNTKERIRSRTKLLLAKIEYFKRVKNLDYFADNISEKWKSKYKSMVNKNIFRKIRDSITEEMITDYLERKELKIKNN